MMEAFDYLGLSGRRWTVGDSIFEALPEQGARLMRWKWRGRDILHWPDDLIDPGQVPGAYGGNPILFPFPARCFVDGVACQWVAPDGICRPMPMHGLARQGRFTIRHADERGFESVFYPDDEARKAYPFNYAFSVSYRFAEDELICEFILENRDNCLIPWSAGHHFYFRLPFIDGVGLAAHRVQLAATKACQVNPTTKGKMVSLPPFGPDESLGNPLLASAVIHYGLKSNQAHLMVQSDSLRREISLRHGVNSIPSFDLAFVTWSPDVEGPFYCVEPWMGPANSPEHKTGLHCVPPGGRHSHVVTVRLSQST